MQSLGLLVICPMLFNPSIYFFPKQTSKPAQILVRKHELKQYFHKNNTGKTQLHFKADTVTKQSISEAQFKYSDHKNN